MTEATDDPLQGLNRLVGEWVTEATHPMRPGLVVHGRATIEWLQGEKFLVVRATTDQPEFPDSISVLGYTEGLHMHYFDDRGVYRVLDVSMIGEAWEMSRDAPGFSQRFSGTFEDGGSTIVGRWQLSRDDQTWADDLQITYRRV